MLGLLAVGAVLVLALWVHGADPAPGLGARLTDAGRVTGLLGSYACVALVVLMARLPVLEHGVGADRLARWHALGGRWAIGLLSAHAVLITWGYAVTGHTGVAGQAVTLVLDYPDVLAATVALGLLLGVAAVSMRAARRRMAYETWYWLHFYTYLALALAFAHQLATGSHLVDDRWARWSWSGMYAGAAVAVLWRFAVPVRDAVRTRTRVAAVHREAPGVVSVEVSGRGLDRLGARPGQFFRLRVLDREGWWQSHPYSLSAPATPSLLRFTVKDLGDESARLARLAPGTRLALEGPYGALTSSLRSRAGVLLLGAGVGITPLRALFEELDGDVVLVQRARTAQDLLLREELDVLARRPGARVVPVVGPRGGPREVTTAAGLLALVPDVAGREVYVCGPDGFMTAARAALRAAGVPDRHVHAERFSLDGDRA